MKPSNSHRPSRLPAHFRQHGSARITPPSESAVALVVTLIMLAVITFMAITFLVLSRSEHGAVATETDQTQARLAAQTGMERAISETLSTILTYTNEFKPDHPWVSTNYISPVGFVPGNGSVLNVNYAYANGRSLSAADNLQNIANLFYNPRVPVYVTNRLFANSNEFRYYLDLNRNGRYDTNGLLPVIGYDPQHPYYSTNGTPMATPDAGVTVSNFFVGDPEWIGILSLPDRRHAADNRFISRFAYIVLPIDNTLDVNYWHDNTKGPNLAEGFLRNQGVGSWEINGASFLADLNTNIWNNSASPYDYEPYLANQGVAFEDAAALLRYRYYATPANLFTVNQLFGNTPGGNAFRNDFIDGYSGGPVMTATTWPVPTDNDVSKVGSWGWPGSYNTNHFFTPEDFFDRGKTRIGVNSGSLGFTDRLLAAGNGFSSYDRYTFYRMLAQLGTDSAPESGKLNVNYCNVDRFGNVVPGMETNFIPWQPIQFFTNAANRLLRQAGYTFTTANIPLYPTNAYTPNVHRLLQVAANIYEATSTNFSGTTPFPTVFRPLFSSTTINGTNVVTISGYQEVGDSRTLVGNASIYWHDLTVPSDRVINKPYDMIYGVPLVVGARKGFPEFNKFGLETQVQATRKLQFLRSAGSNSGAIVQTNQMYILSISNSCGVEAWNSYAATYPRPLQVLATADMFAVITNLAGQAIYSNVTSCPLLITNVSTWPGYAVVGKPSDVNTASFVFGLTNYPPMTNSVYSFVYKTFVPVPMSQWELSVNGLEVPHWTLNLRTRLRFIIVDTQANRIVDYVNLDSIEPPMDVVNTLAAGADCTALHLIGSAPLSSMWCTNQLPNKTGPNGVLNQIAAALGDTSLVPPQWIAKAHGAEVDFFRAQFPFKPALFPGQDKNASYSTTNTFYTPFTPASVIYYNSSWEANDPLVHFTIPDLTDAIATTNHLYVDNDPDSPVSRFGKLNEHYRPWGGGINPGASTLPTDRNMAVKDPVIHTNVNVAYSGSDNWDFPATKYPNVGWLGRVHRGTPWQTVYMKSGLVDTNIWKQWVGDNYWVVITNGLGQSVITNESNLSLPSRDWAMLDIFTASINDNATRGQLSVNQDGLAAWSAVLGGVNVMPNAFTNMFIPPAGGFAPGNPNTLPGIARIVNGINRTRAGFTNAVFHHLGDVLATPELTVASPFLAGNTNLMNDAVYERIPQQILGLLRCDHTPRFVIYSYGQALKPADHSVVTLSGPFFQLCTNYQIVAETATRAVVRIEGVPQPAPPGTAQPPITRLHAVIESFNVLPPD